MNSFHLQGLPDKDRKPASAKVLSQWIRHAADLTGETHSRLEWIVISTIVIAALQRASGPDGAPLFLLKGGVYLEHRLGLESRATKDVDTLFRGSLDDFMVKLDEALAEPWDGLDLRRSEIEKIENAPRIVAPRRFNVIVSMKGRTFRNVQVEVAFPEGDIDKHVDMIPAPRFNFFGLQSVAEIAGIALAYQVAQKIHACSDPHSEERPNLRVRDMVDLVLLRRHFYSRPVSAELSELRRAAEDIFFARADEAAELGMAERSWPPRIKTNELWEVEFPRPAAEVGLQISLAQALAEVTDWVTAIAESDLGDGPS